MPEPNTACFALGRQGTAQRVAEQPFPMAVPLQDRTCLDHSLHSCQKRACVGLGGKGWISLGEGGASGIHLLPEVF